MRTRNQFITKKDLNNALKETESRLNKRIDRVIKLLNFHIEPIQKFIKNFDEFKDKVFDKLDWLTGEYKKFNEEHIVLTEQTRRIND